MSFLLWRCLCTFCFSRIISYSVVLDRTYKFKEILIISYLGTCLSLIWFSFSLRPDSCKYLVSTMEFIFGSFVVGIVVCRSRIFHYSNSTTVFGSSSRSYLPQSNRYFSFIQDSHLASEELSSGLMMAAAQVFGIIFILAMNPMVRSLKIHETTVMLSAFAGVSTLSLLWFKAEYKRFNAENQSGVITEVKDPELTYGSITLDQ